MANLNLIGIDKTDASALSDSLNKLLADYQLFYINARGYHWNIKGEKFFELHLKFEELYNDFQLKIDEIAERILTLGYTPLHSYTNYLNNSHLAETPNVSDGKQAVGHILEGFKVLISQQRQIMAQAQAANDEGTAAMMSDYIRAQEKTTWMYASFLA